MQLPMDLVLRLQLVLEELFLNTIQHGYGGDSEAVVRLALERGEERLWLHYEDRAPAFNPLAYPLANEEPGHAGIALIRQLPETAHYDFRDGANCLRLGFLPT